MAWLQKFLGRKRFPAGPGILDIAFDTSGWNLQKQSTRSLHWTDADQDVLGLDLDDYGTGFPDFGYPPACQQFFRELAERRGAGLVSAEPTKAFRWSAARAIYKREFGTGYVYT